MYFSLILCWACWACQHFDGCEAWRHNLWKISFE